MRTNIVIDDILLNKALELSGLETKAEVVEEALRLYVKMKNQSKLKKFRGKLKWEGDIHSTRLNPATQ